MAYVFYAKQTLAYRLFERIRSIQPANFYVLINRGGFSRYTLLTLGSSGIAKHHE